MVIPIHDRNPVRRVPIVTYLLIALNFAVFFTEPIAFSSVTGNVATAQACKQQAYFYRWGAIPKELLSNEQLEATPSGAVAGPDACEVAPPEYEKEPVASAVTAMFLHGGWLHLLGNMLYLFVFGNNVEDRLGRLRFLLLYLVWGLVAAYAFALTQPGSDGIMVGASGAVAGVLGSYLVLFPKARVISLVPFLFFLPLPMPAWIVLGLWFVLQAFYSAGAGLTEGSDVAYVAHVGGFVAGFVAARLLNKRQGRHA